MDDLERALRRMIELRQRMINDNHEIVSRQTKEFFDKPLTLQEKNKHFVEKIGEWEDEIYLLKAVFQHAGMRYVEDEPLFKEGTIVEAVETFVAEANYDDDEGDDVIKKGTTGRVVQVYSNGSLAVRFNGDPWTYYILADRVRVAGF